MDKRTTQKIKEYISEVTLKNKQVIKAYLFGSYAKNTERDESDIDIAFIINNLKDEDKFDTQVQLMLLASDFDNRIEPHAIAKKDFNIDYPLISEIKKYGIEIK